jgi:patatin-like phospholipase/acyl hydrolase
MDLLERLTAPGPKRILALDGGGIRGALTLGFLEQIERLLRRRHGDEKLKLCDYFDLIGGTSTGAIIATGLASGMEATEIKRFYLKLGGRVFSRPRLTPRGHRFDHGPLERELDKIFKDRRLGDSSLRTGLCVVTKRADTNSVWPLINHPRGKYYSDNKQLRLKDVLRASTAAPGYFFPVTIDVGGGEKAMFVDGGISVAKNPALQLFLVATLRGFRFRWPRGKDNLLLVSIGTGHWDQRDNPRKMAGWWVLKWAKVVPEMFMADGDAHAQLMLQYLSQSDTAAEIDGEVGTLDHDMLTAEPALTYVRYNVALDGKTLSALKLGELAYRAHDLRRMERAKNRFDLARIGERAAVRDVEDRHFPAAFDLPRDTRKTG